MQRRISPTNYRLLETVGKVPKLKHSSFSKLGGSIFDGKSGSILGGNLQGGITRVEKQEANKLLKSADLLLCIAGLYHMLKGWKETENSVNLSDIRLFIPA
jgi:hypothetical protein